MLKCRPPILEFLGPQYQIKSNKKKIRLLGMSYYPTPKLEINY